MENNIGECAVPDTARPLIKRGYIKFSMGFQMRLTLKWASM